MSVLLGNGDGTFGVARNYAVGQDPVALAVGDFTADGQADLAVLGDDTVSVLLGNGDGTFQTARSFAVGTYPDSLIVGDFTGNGKLDLAVANSADYTVSVLLGNGDGTFQAAQTFAVGVDPASLASADFNGDGKLDVGAVTPANNTVTVLLGNGDGTFKAPQNFAVGHGPTAVAVGDFNGDRKLEMAVANADSNTVSILLGNGNGTFKPAQSYAVGKDPTALIVGDFTNNGKLDLAVADSGGNAASNTVSILLGNGNGTFKPAQSVTVGYSPVSLAVGDFNGDGNLDLAVSCAGSFLSGIVRSSEVAVLLGNGSGTFQTAQILPGAGAIVAGDFYGGGKPDLAVGGVAVFRDQATPGGLTPGSLTPPVATEGQRFTSADVFHFTDFRASASAFTAMVTLGDGNTLTLNATPSSSGQIVANPGGGFDVQLSYSYAEELNDATFAVQVSDVHGAATGASTKGFSVADADLSAGAFSPPVGREGQAFSNMTVFQVSDADPAASAGDYTATVTLGDGNTVTLTNAPSSSGQIVADPAGGFDVQLSYVYSAALFGKGFAVHVGDSGGATTGAGSVVDQTSLSEPAAP